MKGETETQLTAREKPPGGGLHETARALVAAGKGILAADESSGTIEKRLATVGVASTEETRRAYRELLFTTRGLDEYISGVILFDETIRQSASNGQPFPLLLERVGIIPGIKVDKGAKPLALAQGETITEGLDELRERLAEYRGLGARFAKWRATYSIGGGRPSEYCVRTNAHALARYAALCQEAGLVPIVEPEVLMDGDHSIDTARDTTGRVLSAVYAELHDQRVDLRGTLLKPNMVLSGYDAAHRAGPGGCQADARVPLPTCADRRARGRLPLGRPVRRGLDGSPERDQRARPAPVAALVLLRARPAGAGAQGVGWTPGERRSGSAGVAPPGEDERRGPHRRLHTGARARGRCVRDRPLALSALLALCGEARR